MLPAIKPLVRLPLEVRTRVLEMIEFLPGLPANANNIGAVVNYLREGHSIEYNDKESEIDNN